MFYLLLFDPILLDHLFLRHLDLNPYLMIVYDFQNSKNIYPNMKTPFKNGCLPKRHQQI